MWKQPVKDSWYAYMYDPEKGADKYLGRVNEDGTIYNKDRWKGPPDAIVEETRGPGEPQSDTQVTPESEQAFQALMMAKMMRAMGHDTGDLEDEGEVIEVHRDDDYELAVVRKGDEDCLIIMSSDEEDFDDLKQSVSQYDSMHPMEETSVEGKRGIIVERAPSDIDDEGRPEFMEIGRGIGGDFHENRMRRKIWNS